jgi:hypothetical protein
MVSLEPVVVQYLFSLQQQLYLFNHTPQPTMSGQRPSHIDIPSAGMNGTTATTEDSEVEMQDVTGHAEQDEHEIQRRRLPDGPHTPILDPDFKRTSTSQC